MQDEVPDSKSIEITRNTTIQDPRLIWHHETYISGEIFSLSAQVDSHQ